MFDNKARLQTIYYFNSDTKAKMLNFSEQCMDMARAILGRNLDSINADGTITPFEGEQSSAYEAAHAAFALGEFYRASGESEFQGFNIIDLASRCISAQFEFDSEDETGVGYSALALLSFGPAKDRNPVWEKLTEETMKHIDRQLLARTDYDDFRQVFNIAKAVTRFSMGLSKKDETGKLIDRLLERIQATSSGNYFDDKPGEGIAGVFDIMGLASFVFTRQALQLHANMHLRDRKIPSLRTFAEKYLKLMGDMVRADGLGWNYGRNLGAYGQMYTISILLQAMRDGWIQEDKMGEHMDILCRLFQFFFMTFLDQEHGYVVVNDAERTTDGNSTRTVNFDAARYLCQWARLAKTIARPLQPQPAQNRSFGKFVGFDNSSKKEQGLFVYHNAESGMHLHLPLIASGAKNTSSSLAFPHMPGIFDWPANSYMPILVPELTFGGKATVPSFYGKKCTSGMGLRNSFFFRFEQPELISSDCEILPGIGSCKVNWNFSGNKITADFIYSVKQQIQMEKMRFMVAIAAPHSEHHVPSTYTIGENGLGIGVEKDDFQAEWQDTVVVSDDPAYRTFWGKVHYLQVLERKHPMVMRPGLQYRLTVSFEPDITFVG